MKRSHVVFAGTFVGLTVITLAAAGPQASKPAAQAPKSSMGQMDGMGMGTMKMPTDAEMTQSAMSAGPMAVVKNATIMGMDDKMQPRTIRKGTNGWTCLPDMPQSPGKDPMCLDQNGLAWAMALMSKTNPPAGKMGFGYMLAGGSDASNTDPFATKPAAGHQWIETGPHVMVLNPGTSFAGYPATPGDAKTPYVMWGGTPYQHLMIPVK